MKFKLLFFTLCTLLITVPCIAQVHENENNPDTEQIKELIALTFKAMKLGDTTLLKSYFYNNASLQVNTIKNDSSMITVVPLANFVVNIGKQQKGSLDEQVTSWGNISIDKNIATAWVPYSFYLNGIFSHKGIDAFSLVKTNQKWKIQSLLYNMYK